MLVLKATIFNNRDFLGKLKYEDEHDIYEYDLSAKADSGLAIPDPPAGKYKLVRIISTEKEDADVIAGYGPYIIFFEAMSGPAAERPKNSKNGFILALHGGDRDVSDQLLPTEGSLRMSNTDLIDLVILVSVKENVLLYVSEEKIGLLGRFTKPKVSKQSTPRISYTRVRGSSGGYYGEGHDGILDSPIFWLWMFGAFDSPVQAEFTPGPEDQIQSVAPGEVEPQPLDQVVDQPMDPVAVQTEPDRAEQVNPEHHEERQDTEPLPVINDPYAGQTPSVTLPDTPQAGESLQVESPSSHQEVGSSGTSY